MRSLLPNEGIIYLETNDLAKTLESLTDNQAFRELAEEKPDFSFLENVQLGVVITNFQSSEKQIGEESSILSFTPQFVAVAETHAWSWQTVSFVENQLNRFVKRNYGEDANLETIEKESGKFFTWTASDKRRVFAFVRDSSIYFGNDAEAIEKCLKIKKGEAESLLKNDALARAYAGNNLAFGYISTEGIRQIANFAGVSIAIEASAETGERNFIARVLPQVLQNTTSEITWTANKTSRGIEDNFTVSLKAEAISILKNNLATTETTANSVDYLPTDFFSATRYNLKNPLIAWRGLLFLAAKNTDAVSSSFLLKFSGALLEPYGIFNEENFLSSIGSEIMTVQFDAEGEKSAVIASIKNAETLKNSISKKINFSSSPTVRENAEIWFSGDRQQAAAFIGSYLILGESESVLKCLQAKQSERRFIKNINFQSFLESQSIAATFGKDTDSAAKTVEILAKQKIENRKLATVYLTETRLTEGGIERKTISDYGLIGTIIAQVEK